MNSISKSKEYKLFKVKLNDLIVCLQNLDQTEWEEAINLVYNDLGYAVKESSSVNGLHQYNSNNKELHLFPLPLKSEFVKIVKPIESKLMTNDFVSNFDLNCKRQEFLEKSSNMNNLSDKEHLNEPNLQGHLSFKNNFIDPMKLTSSNSSVPITYSILNLSSRNKFYDDKKNINAQNEAIFNSSSKKKCEEVDTRIIQNNRENRKLQLSAVEICNENINNYDCYNESNCDNAKGYLCNDEPICTQLNDSVINGSQKRSEYMDIKSKSAEISLWKFQPEIISEFQTNLDDQLDLFNFSRQQEPSDNRTEILPLKDLVKCSNNNKLHDESFVYDFSNNYVENSTYKGTNYSHNTSTCVTALNLVNRKEADKETPKMKPTFDHLKNQETSGDNICVTPLSCLNCKLKIDSDFNRHQLNCFTNKFVCIHCHVPFNNKITFLKHLSSLENNKCKNCAKSFCRYAKLRQHMGDVHNISLPRRIHSCQYCTRTFYKPASLFHHYKLHAEGKQKVCEKCGMFCSDENEFKLHMANHFKNGLQCIKCNEIFLRKQQYEKHLRTHENYKCDYCTKTFSCKRKLYTHCKAEHLLRPKGVKLDKQYPCDECNKVFNRPFYLNLHKKRHLGIKPLFECVICSKRFNEKRCLLKHYNSFLHQYNLFLKNRIFDGVNSFACGFCKLILPSERMLRFHCDLDHKTERQESCRKCDFKCNSKLEYKKHIKGHSKKLFICEICGKGFLTFSILKDHHIYLHSTERNFSCKVCSKSFKKKSLLSRHMNTHVAEKRHKCKCGAAFKQMSNLTRHISSLHSQEDHNKKTRSTTKCKNRKPKNAYEDSTEYKTDVIETDNELVLGDNNISPQFSVFDSHLIELVPSTLQFGENLQSVSIINSDLASFAIPTAYTIAQSEESIVDDTNIESDLIGSQSYSQLTAMTTAQSENIKKKSFHVDMDSINVSELAYANISESDETSMQSGDNIQPSLKQANISPGSKLLQNIIF